MASWTKWHEKPVEGETPRPGVKRYGLRVGAKPYRGSKVRNGRRFYVQEFANIDLFGSGAISPSKFEIKELDPVYTQRPNRRVIAWRERSYARVFKTDKAAWAFVDTFRE